MGIAASFHRPAYDQTSSAVTRIEMPKSSSTPRAPVPTSPMTFAKPMMCTCTAPPLSRSMRWRIDSSAPATRR